MRIMVAYKEVEAPKTPDQGHRKRPGRCVTGDRTYKIVASTENGMVTAKEASKASTDTDNRNHVTDR
jgi:hypothetical protein